MKIADILSNHIVPFETEDMKLKSLFSFFFASCTNESALRVRVIPEGMTCSDFGNLLRETRIQNDSFRFYTSGSINKKQLERYSLSSSSTVSRKSNCFICSRKSADGMQMSCLLRHLRNSIAHSNVYLLNNNRKYILFDDFNTKQNRSARILLSQGDLKVLKKYLR